MLFNFNVCASLLRVWLNMYLFVPGQIKIFFLLKPMYKVIFNTPTKFLGNSFQNRGENCICSIQTWCHSIDCYKNPSFWADLVHNNFNKFAHYYRCLWSNRRFKGEETQEKGRSWFKEMVLNLRLSVMLFIRRTKAVTIHIPD